MLEFLEIVYVLQCGPQKEKHCIDRYAQHKAQSIQTIWNVKENEELKYWEAENKIAQVEVKYGATEVQDTLKKGNVDFFLEL